MTYMSELNVLNLVLEQFSQFPQYQNIFELDFHGVSFVDDLIAGNIFVPQFNFCASCGNQVVFDGNKNVYTCWWGANSQIFEIGKVECNKIVIDSNKRDIWYNHSIDTINKCKKCKYRYICGGGCVFKAYTNHGSIKEGNCSDFYNIIEAYLRYKLAQGDMFSRLLNLKFSIIRKLLIDNKYLIIKAEGNSMEPAIYQGERVIISSNIEEINVGDIVLYISQQELKIHRIIAETNMQGYSLKGDNEEYTEKIRVGNILGKVVKDVARITYSEKIERNVGKYRMIIEVKNGELISIGVCEHE